MDFILSIALLLFTVAGVIIVGYIAAMVLAAIVYFLICALVAFFVIDPTDCYQCPFGEGSLQCETCRIHKWKQKHGGNK